MIDPFFMIEKAVFIAFIIFTFIMETIECIIERDK